MKGFPRLLCIFGFMMFISAPLWGADDAAPPAGLEDPYLIGAGDVLDISVWKDEAQTKRVVVLPDGTISFPLIGQVMAAGKSVAKLKEEIRVKESQFVPDPVVTVIVHQVNSMLIYVVGRVNNPGRFQLSTNVNVLQAIAMAGGLDGLAKHDKITIMREDGKKTVLLPFNYDEVTAGDYLQQNVRLHRGDIVVVP